MEPPAPNKQSSALNFCLLLLGAAFFSSIIMALRDDYRVDPRDFATWLFLFWGPLGIASLLLLISYRADARRDPGKIIAGVFSISITTGLLVVLLPALVNWILRPQGEEIERFKIISRLLPGLVILPRYFKRSFLWFFPRIRQALVPLFPEPVQFVPAPVLHGKRPVDPPIAKPGPLPPH